MHKTLLALVLVGSFVPTSLALAQQSTAGWAAVQALNSGTNVHVIGRSNSTVCRLAKVDESSLTCAGVGTSAGEVFQKADIKKVALPHKGRSALVGLAIGAGVGAGIGAGVGASQSSSNNNIRIPTSWVAAVGAVVFGLFGALFGSVSDFMGSTIYRG